jgi:hypothetical protein
MPKTFKLISYNCNCLLGLLYGKVRKMLQCRSKIAKNYLFTCLQYCSIAIVMDGAAGVGAGISKINRPQALPYVLLPQMQLCGYYFA